MTRSIQHQLSYPHPPEVVWEYLTDPELMAMWLMKNDFQPSVGHEFTFRTNPMPAFNFDGIIYCTVLEIVPSKKLVYSWKGGPGNGEMTMDSIVTWTLEKQAGGTLLSLQHTGFEKLEDPAIFFAMEKGWLTNMHKIAEHIKTKQYGNARS